MRKKITALLLLLFLSSLFVYIRADGSTQYFPVNTSWKEVTTNLLDEAYCRIDEYLIGEETTINTILYRKVFRNGVLYAALRESEEKVLIYFFDIEKEKLIYDFSWSIGKRLSFQPHYSDEYMFQPEITEIKQMKLLDGMYYDYVEYSGNIKTIKGIGGESGFFTHMFEQPANGDQIRLLCCMKNDMLIYKNLAYRNCESCERSETKINHINKKQFVRYINNMFYFSFDDEQEKTLSIYDCTGKELCSYDISNKSFLPINGLKNGIYFYRIISKNNKLCRGTFVYI